MDVMGRETKDGGPGGFICYFFYIYRSLRHVSLSVAWGGARRLFNVQVPKEETLIQGTQQGRPG